jgi:hypothetical protein
MKYRLIKERENGFAVESKVKPKKGKHHDPLQNQEGIKDFEMRGAVPGTSIEGEVQYSTVFEQLSQIHA